MADTVKCVIWDLDNTVWHGILVEGDEVVLRTGIAEVLEELDRRGILHAIASRNDHDQAVKQLADFGLDEWFLHREINFGDKAASVERIARNLNIGLDTILFVDDDPVELASVSAVHPVVRTLDSAHIGDMLQRPDLSPAFVTPEAAQRRRMYREDQRRTAAQESFDGPPEQVLAAMHLVYTVRRARESDLARAGELTVRTNQLNSTGHPYSVEELDRLRVAPDHDLLVMELTDDFGSFGTVGLALVEREPGLRTLRLLLTSCRVMSRGAGGVLLNHIVARAHDAGDRCRAAFEHTGRNRVMYAMFKFADFQETYDATGALYLQAPPGHRQPTPAYLTLNADW